MEPNITTTASIVDSDKQNNGKGWKIATAIASVVAICGVGLGVYGMIQSSQKDNQISDLKVQVEDSNGKITALETEKIETTDGNGTTVTITDSALAKLNPVVISSDVDGSVGDGYTDVYSLTASSSLYSDGDMNKSWSLTSHDGDLTCQIKENYTIIDNCDISAHGGKVSNIYSVGLGNGIEDYILILTDTGEIEYLTDAGEDYKVLKKLSLPKKVSQVYPNVSSMSVDSEGHSLGSGRDALIVYSDGQIADFYDIMHK
jgi:hypothetical protein